MSSNMLQVENVLSVYSDEELVMLSKLGNKKAEELLLERYRSLVEVKTSSYFLAGADRDDIIQEGMIGLLKSMRDYDPNRNTSFKVFAEVCIRRQIVSAVKAATRQKHHPLNTSVSLDMPIHEECSNRMLIDAIANSQVAEPEAIIIHREQMDAIEEQLCRVLSKLERSVLINYVNGKSYCEMAKDLNRHVKCIDNALQRVKKKLEVFLEEKTLEEPYT